MSDDDVGIDFIEELDEAPRYRRDVLARLAVGHLQEVDALWPIRLPPVPDAAPHGGLRVLRSGRRRQAFRPEAPLARSPVGHKSHVRVDAPREQRSRSDAFVVRVRRDNQDTRGHDWLEWSFESGQWGCRLDILGNHARLMKYTFGCLTSCGGQPGTMERVPIR